MLDLVLAVAAFFLSLTSFTMWSEQKTKKEKQTNNGDISIHRASFYISVLVSFFFSQFSQSLVAAAAAVNADI